MAQRNFSKIYSLFVTVALIVVVIIVFNKKSSESLFPTASDTSVPLTSEQTDSSETLIPTVSNLEPGGWQTFKFHSFHGQSLGNAGFELQYPVSWYNDGQYFSQQKIQYYDITSTDAPVYYDLVYGDIFDTSDIKYQINNDKRIKPDSTVKIDDKSFRRYELTDYQNKDRVIIFVGPSVNIFGKDYYLVFRWEDHPLGLDIRGNDPAVFEKMVMSLKFTK